MSNNSRMEVMAVVVSGVAIIALMVSSLYQTASVRAVENAQASLEIQAKRIEEKSSRMDEISADRFFRFAERNRNSWAIQIDSDSKVTYLNDLAKRDLDLEVGDALGKIMPLGIRSLHNEAYTEGNQQHELTGPLLVERECEVISKSGKVKVYLEAWTTSTGGAAFITPVKDET